jgi:hypothetical protein
LYLSYVFIKKEKLASSEANFYLSLDSRDKKMIRIALTIICICILSACAASPPSPHVHNQDGLTIVSTTADVEGLIIKERSSQEQMCAGRMVNVSDTSDVSLGVSQLTTAESIGESSGAISLGGINPAVHMTSELMYRACELSLNLNLDDEGSLKIYNKVLSAIVSISEDYKTSASTSSTVSTPSFMETVKPTAVPETISGDSASSAITSDTTDASGT